MKINFAKIQMSATGGNLRLDRPSKTVSFVLRSVFIMLRVRLVLTCVTFFLQNPLKMTLDSSVAEPEPPLCGWLRSRSRFFGRSEPTAGAAFSGSG